MPAFHRFGQPPEGALPPQQVRILELRPELLDDRRKLRVYLQITPFLENPDLEVSVMEVSGEEITHASIIGTAEDRFVFTLHLRKPDLPDRLTLTCQLTYAEIGAVDTKSVEIELPSVSE